MHMEDNLNQLLLKIYYFYIEYLYPQLLLIGKSNYHWFHQDILL